MDLFVFFVSGVSAEEKGKPYLLTYDSKPADIKSYLGLDEVVDSLATTHGRVLFIFDGCGASVGKSLGSLLQAANTAQISILTSAAPGERAMSESPFAATIVKALRLDKAAVDSRGQVTVESLGKFVTREMPVSAKQHPQLVTSEPSLALVTPQPKTAQATVK